MLAPIILWIMNEGCNQGVSHTLQAVLASRKANQMMCHAGCKGAKKLCATRVSSTHLWIGNIIDEHSRMLPGESRH